MLCKIIILVTKTARDADCFFNVGMMGGAGKRLRAEYPRESLGDFVALAALTMPDWPPRKPGFYHLRFCAKAFEISTARIA